MTVGQVITALRGMGIDPTEINISKAKDISLRYPTESLSGAIMRYTDMFDEAKEVVWQRCPKCEGLGEVLHTPSWQFFSKKIVCPICKGKMIISLLTGRPPKD